MHVIGAGVAGGVAVAAIVVFVVVRHFRKKSRQQADKKKREAEQKPLLGQGIRLSRSAPYPVQLHFSPTVSFEYHLLPGQSI